MYEAATYPYPIVCLVCGYRRNKLSTTDHPICRECDSIMVGTDHPLAIHAPS